MENLSFPTGMRKPSWNKSQAIQQVISLKALLEPDTDAGSRKKLHIPRADTHVRYLVHFLFLSPSIVLSYVCYTALITSGSIIILWLAVKHVYMIILNNSKN